MRTFIAIELPEHVRAEVFHKFEKLSEGGLVRGDFVEKENLHLTLKFLGEIDEEKVKEVIKKLGEIKMVKFSCETGKIGFFPSEDYVKVIWIDLISEEVKKLQQEIENKLTEIGIKKDDREFTSHVTLVRVKELKNKDVFHEKIKKLGIKKQKCNVDKFLLIKSELTRQGPIYKTIKEFELR
ncbi:MAG: RNA 2',3'-cyclic phosphodiesterase [Nanoarchaeota archaeon]|nr:RNA 2',3'-cyclic phosphodiesterase [Nanoarchaeota archaeon]